MKYENMAISVSELNSYIKNKIADDEYLNNVLVKGEISNFKNHYTGHMYFTLKDETMKRLMFLVAAVLACHSMQAQYFCTTEGTELHYVNYDEIGQSTSDETMTVSKVEKVDGKPQAAYYDKIVTTKAKNNTSYTLFNWSYDGANTVCTEDLMYGPYVDSDSDPAKYNEAARLGLLEKLKFKGDNSFTIKDGAKGGESIPDRSYQVVRNMLKNEVNVSGAAYMGNETISTLLVAQLSYATIAHLMKP